MELFDKINDEIKADKIHIDDNIAKVSIVGAGMIDRPGVAATMFDTLANLNINIKMIAQGSQELTIIVGVSNKDLKYGCRCGK